MSNLEQNPARIGLKHLDGRSFSELLAWLDRALRGQEALPRVVPDESPEEPILRHERGLDRITRQDLREACRQLVRRFVREPRDEDDFVGALLRLAKGFELDEIVSDLHALAQATERFSPLPPAQQKALVSALVDLKAPLTPSFWWDLASHDPRQLGVLAFSGLLRHGMDAASRILPSLPDDEAVADAVYVVMGQHARLLEVKERDRLVAAMRGVASQCQPAIGAALVDWADEQEVAADSEPQDDEAAAAHPDSPSRAALHGALASWARTQGKIFKPEPASARLQPAA